MDRKRLLKIIAILMLVLFLLDLGAKMFFWYSSIWWFDVLMHFSAGLWVGLFFSYVFTAKEHVVPVFKVLVWVFIVGFLWEIYEFYVYQYLMDIPFKLGDTTSDMFLDLFGGLCAILYLNENS